MCHLGSFYEQEPVQIESSGPYWILKLSTVHTTADEKYRSRYYDTPQRYISTSTLTICIYTEETNVQ